MCVSPWHGVKTPWEKLVMSGRSCDGLPFENECISHKGSWFTKSGVGISDSNRCQPHPFALVFSMVCKHHCTPNIDLLVDYMSRLLYLGHILQLPC